MKSETQNSVEVAQQLIRALAWRVVPPSMRHWQEDIVAEAVVEAWLLRKARGYRTTRAVAWFSLLHALSKHSRYARDLPGMFDHPDRSAAEDYDRVWCMHKLTQRWHLLTSKQQEAVFALLTERSAESWSKHGLNYRFALEKLSLGREGYGKEIRNTTVNAAEVRAAKDRGADVDTLAEQFGCSVATIYNALKATRPANEPTKKYVPSSRDLYPNIVEMNRSGFTAQQIAGRLELSKGIVYRAIREARAQA